MRLSVATSLLTAMMVSRKAKAQPSSYATCRAYPDPHFQTWDNIYYDYHGSCDAVLIQNPTFDGTDVFNLHLRTEEIDGSWGGIKRAALQIGTDKLEVLDDGTSFLNGAALAPGDPAGLMGSTKYVLTYTTAASSDVWEVNLKNAQYVLITNYKNGNPGSISVQVYASASRFINSVGMCGTWQQPGLIARDGTTDYQGDPNAGNLMGLDWQVLAAEPNLFSDPPPAPGVCTQGPVGHGTGQGGDGAGDAEKACKDVEGQDFNNCVFDVIATGTRDWVKAPLYHNYECDETDNMCKRVGGTCIELKDCDVDTLHCVPGLCHANNIPDWLLALDGKNAGEELSDERDPCVCAIRMKFASGKCCHWKGPLPWNCAAYDSLNPAHNDLDGECNQAQGGSACEWNYDDPECCKIALNDADCNLPNDEAAEACECALRKEQGLPMLQAASSLRALPAGGA